MSQDASLLMMDIYQASNTQSYDTSNYSAGEVIAYNRTNMTQDGDMRSSQSTGNSESFSNLFQLYAVPILVIVGTIGNILILLTVRQKNLSNWSICFYLAAYAVVNIFILVPMSGLEWLCSVTDTKYIMNITDWTCKLWQFLMSVIIYSGIWFVFAMLVDQYITIWLPLRAQTMCTIFMAKFAIVIILVGLVVVSIHAIWTYELFPNGCYLNHHPNDLLTTIWPWVSISCYCIIPLCLIVIFIVLLIFGVLTKNTWKKTSSNYQVPIDVTFMTIALSIFYMIFVTPASVIHIIKMNLPNAWLHDLDFYRKLEIAGTVGDLLTYLNPSLAFFVCITFSSTFRTELRDMLRNFCCKHVIRVYEMQVNSNRNAGTDYENCSETTPL